MTQRIKDSLYLFKNFVDEIEYVEDTLALDRALGEASTLLYDTRHAIDMAWMEKRKTRPQAKLGTLPLFTDAELAEALAVIQGQYTGDES